jgi:hypothetical protein
MPGAKLNAGWVTTSAYATLAALCRAPTSFFLSGKKDVGSRDIGAFTPICAGYARP